MSTIGHTIIPMVEHECTQLTLLLGQPDFDSAILEDGRIMAQSGKTLHAVLHLFAICGGAKDVKNFDEACRLLGISSTLEPVKAKSKISRSPTRDNNQAARSANRKTMTLPSRRAPAR